MQVIAEALKRTADLAIESIDSMNAKSAGDLRSQPVLAVVLMSL